MDISKTTEPKSDQQNYDDYMSGPKTVTITEVKAGSSEQPVELHLAEYPGRPYKPGKSMRRVLVACWGAEASAYVGRKLTLYGDPSVRFGGQAVGGIRIAALSHLDGPREISLTVTRGKRAPFVVQPLTEALSRDWLAELADAEGDADLIFTLGKSAKAAGAPDQILSKLAAAYRAAGGE
jgi:hypothetical protein